MLKVQARKPMVATLVAGLLLAGAQISLAQNRSDSQIEADVNSKLQADPQLSNATVGVGVQDGVVTLTGNVGQNSQLDQAENDLTGIQGVTKIIDNLQVNATAPMASAPVGAQNDGAPAAQNAAPPVMNDPENDRTDVAPGQQGQMQQGQMQQGQMQQGQIQQGQMQQGQMQQGPGQPGQMQQQGPNGPGMQQGPYGGQQQGQNGPPPGYGPGPGYGQGYNRGPQGPGGQGGYDQYQRRPRPVRYDPGNRQVTLPMGSVLTVRTLDSIQAGVTQPNSFFKAVVAQDVMGDQGIAIPRGTAVTGQVIESKKAGHFKGAAVLTLRLTNLVLGPQELPLPTDTWGQYAGGKGGATAGNAIAGGAFGAIVGAIAGGGPGAAIGAAAGGVAGGASTGLSGTPHAYVPAEGLVSFRLTAPITVTTVTPDQARLLANAAPPLGPQQPRRRPPPPPGAYYGPYGPYPY